PRLEDHEVLRLHVPMDDVLIVARGQPQPGLLENFNDLGKRETAVWLVRQDSCEIAPRDKLHDEESPPAPAAGIEQQGHVWRNDALQGFDLFTKAPEVLVAGVGWTDDELHGHGLLPAAIGSGAVHVAHATFTNLLLKFVPRVAVANQLGTRRETS